MTLSQFITKYNGKYVEYHSYSANANNQLHRPVFLLSKFPSLNSFFKGVKSSNVNYLIINSNFSVPLISRQVISAVNSLVSCFIVFSNFTITNVCRVFTDTQVASSIIKCVPVYVIYIQSTWRIHQKSLHFYQFVTRESFLSVKISSLKRKTPFSTKLNQCLKVFVVNKYIMFSKSFTNYLPCFHGVSLPVGT